MHPITRNKSASTTQKLFTLNFTIITALDQELTINVFKKRKGIYWSYDGVEDLSYGPFNNDQQAINDAKLYSQYGTTSKHLLTT
jgi:hypothetical protein